MKLIITSRWNLWTLILRWEEPKQNHFFQVNLIHTSLLLHELHLLLPLICSSRFSNSFIHSSLDLVSYATPESEEPFSLLLIPQFFSWHPQRSHTCRRDGLRPRRLWADREPEQDINSRGSDQNQEITSALSFIHIPSKSLNKSLWKHGWWFLCCRLQLLLWWGACRLHQPHPDLPLGNICHRNTKTLLVFSEKLVLCLLNLKDQSSLSPCYVNLRVIRERHLTEIWVLLSSIRDLSSLFCFADTRWRQDLQKMWAFCLRGAVSL